MDRRIFGFWIILRKSTNLQGIALYIQSAPTNSSMKGKNIYSVLHVDRLIFGLKNLQIYKELPMDRRIFGFQMLLRKSTNLQGIALYIQSAPTNCFYQREEYLQCFAYGQVDFWVEKSTNLQGIASGQVDFWVMDANKKIYKSTRKRAIYIISSQ